MNRNPQQTIEPNTTHPDMDSLASVAKLKAIQRSMRLHPSYQQRHTETLLQVNKIAMNVDEALVVLDGLPWRVDRSDALTALVDHCLVKEALGQYPVEVCDEDVYRAQAETQSIDLTSQRARRVVEDRVLHFAFRRQLASKRFDSWFIQNEASLERLVIAWRSVPQRDAHETSNVALSLAFNPTLTILEAHEAGFMGEVRAYEMGDLPEFLRSLRSAAEGVVLRLDLDEHALGTVLLRQPARPDTRTRELAEERIFAEWLTERRAECRIKWLPGKVGHLLDDATNTI